VVVTLFPDRADRYFEAPVEKQTPVPQVGGSDGKPEGKHGGNDIGNAEKKAARA
jgi:hypothetical protein